MFHSVPEASEATLHSSVRRRAIDTGTCIICHRINHPVFFIGHVNTHDYTNICMHAHTRPM